MLTLKSINQEQSSMQATTDEQASTKSQASNRETDKQTTEAANTATEQAKTRYLQLAVAFDHV